MKIFLTGITGLLGYNVAETCSKQGFQIVAFVRNKSLKPSAFPFPLALCYGNISDLKSIPRDLEKADVLIHCAADTNMIAFINERQVNTNVVGVKNLVTLAKLNAIAKFIHISTANTIVFGTKEKPSNEENRLPISGKNLPYINSKIEAEDFLLNEFNTNSFPVVILNPTFILGPNDRSISSGKLVLSAIKGKIALFPSGGKNIVDVRDVAKAVYNTTLNGVTGERYLLCNENLTYKEVFNISCGIANVSPPKYKLPNLLASTLGLFGSAYEFFRGKSFALNHKTMKISKQNHYYSAQKAKAQIGFTARAAEETIKDTVNWFIENERTS